MTTESSAQESKEELKRLVIEAITQQCQAVAASAPDAAAASSTTDTATPPADLLACADAISNGHKLHLTILTGGLANYSYRAHFPTAPPETPSLFAKLTFTYALLFPDKPCPIHRTQCEFEAMRIFQTAPRHRPRRPTPPSTPTFASTLDRTRSSS